MTKSRKSGKPGIFGPSRDIELGLVATMAAGVVVVTIGDAVLAHYGLPTLSDRILPLVGPRPDSAWYVRKVHFYLPQLAIVLLYSIYFLIGLAAELGPKALRDDEHVPIWRIYGPMIGFVVAGGIIWVVGELVGLQLSAGLAGAAITIGGPPAYFVWRLIKRAYHEAKHGITDCEP